MRSDVPEGWSPKSIGSLLDWDAPGFWGESPESGGDPVKVLRSTNFTESGIPNLDDIALRCFPERIRTQKALQFGDILLERSGGGPNTPVGRVVLFEERDPHFYSNFIQALRVGAEADYRFLFYVLWNMHKTGVTSTLQQATTGIRNLSYKDYLAWRLPLPPLAEQRKIAAILTSVDEAIQATEAVIAQTRRVKEGLLQELLTKGIGHTRFKQTEIGEIPETWEVRTVEQLLADVSPAMRSGPFGSALLKSELVQEGIPLLGIDNVHVERFESNYKRFVTESKFEELKRYAVKPNDVMITIMGTVGRCCLVPEDIGRALSSKHTWTLTFEPTRYRPYLACTQFNHSKRVLQYFGQAQQGGTMAAIQSSTLRDLVLPVPPIEEQFHIEAVLRSLDEEVNTNVRKLGSLQQLKSGLLQDLLTGRVRV